MISAVLSLSLVACGGDDDGGDDVAAADAAGGGTDDAAPGAGADAAAGTEDLNMTAEDFACILSGTKVRKFYLWNLRGHESEALAVANSPTGGTYPVGTVIQLVPQEAMVKRRVGFNAMTNDWEFFFLNVSANGTTISTRGVEDVENAFGGNCFECHDKAEAQWDLVCEGDHGCDPLGINDAFIENLQNGDARCP